MERVISVRIDTNAPGYTAKIGAAETATRRFGDSTDTAAKAGGRLSGTFLPVRDFTSQAVGAFTGFIGAQAAITATTQVIRTLKDSILGFDDQMTQSLAIMGEVTDSVRESMELTARQTAKDYNMAVSDTAGAYYELASAGMNAAQSQAALPVVAAFAKAGMFDLEKATNLAATAQVAIGLGSTDTGQHLKNLTRVTDVLVEANNAASGAVEDFAKALTNKAAAAAKLAGISLEETVGVLAAFAERGLIGKRAGEAFNIVLRDLQEKSRVNRDEFEALGIAVYDAAGNFAGFPTIIGQLEQGLAGMTVEQTNATLATLGFTVEGVSYLRMLLGTSSAIEGYTERLEAAGGATQRIAENQMTSMVERLKHLKAEAIDLGLRGWGAVQDGIEWIAREFAPAFGEGVELVGDLYDLVRPIGEVLLKAFGGAVIIGLKAFSGGLETSLRFLSENRTALVATTAVAIAPQAASLAVLAARWASLGYTMAAVKLLEVVDGMNRLTVAVRASALSGTLLRDGMAAAQGGLAAFASSAAFLPTVIGAGVVALGLMYTAFRDMDARAQEAAAKITSGINPADIDSVRVAAQKLHEEWKQANADLSTYPGGWQKVGSVLADVLIPFHDVESSVADLSSTLDANSAELKELAEKYGPAVSGIHDLAAAYQKAAVGADAFKPPSLDGLGAQGLQEYEDALWRIAEANNIDLSQPWEVVKPAIEAAYQRTQIATTGELEFADSLAVVGDEASTASDRLDAYKQALDGVVKVHISSYDAATKFADSLQGVTDAVTKNGWGFDLSTKAGRANRDALSGAASAALDHARAVTEESGQIANGNLVLAMHREQLIRVMTQLGYTRQQAEDYIAQLGLTPDALETLVMLNGEEVARAKIEGVQTGLDGVSRGAHGEVTVDTTQANQKLRELQWNAAIAGAFLGQLQANPSQVPTISGRADGGWLDQGWSWVGERGPELAHTAGGRTKILSAPQSRSLMSAGMPIGAGPSIVVSAGAVSSGAVQVHLSGDVSPSTVALVRAEVSAGVYAALDRLGQRVAARR